ncbi:MAG: transglutaminase domain-containing protein [Tissierellales bacterium]
MDRISGGIQKLIYNLIYASIIFSLMYLLGLVIGLELNIFIQVIIIFIGSILVKFFLLNPLILYALLAVSILGAVLVHRFISPFLFTVGDRIFFLFDNIIGNLQGKENIASDNMLLFWGILLILISIFTAFILFKMKKIYLLLPLYIGSFIIYWYNFYDAAYWMISLFLVLFLTLMGLDKFYKVRITVKNPIHYEIEDFYSPWLKTVTTYGIIIVSIAMLLPKSNSYIQWPWLQETIYSIYPDIVKLRSQDGTERESESASLFSFSMTGYQGSKGKLGGPVVLSDKKIMTIHADSNHYLRGNVKHRYMGNHWEALTGSLENHPLGYNFSGITEFEMENYYHETQISITNHSFASTTIFSPYRAVEVYSNDDHVLNVSYDNTLYFPNGVYDREKYFVRVQKPLPYGILASRNLQLKKDSILDLGKYLQVPEDKITLRTKELTRELVKDKKTDLNKATAIESYLRNNYEYNLNVSEVPDDREFIDYFLFDEQEGYCTYFATAMSIMLRLEGIPTRYIEGYLTQETEEPGIYEVRQKNAHAWVEAFIEPVGWMTFEPTPVYPIQSRLENFLPITVENEDSISSEIDNDIREPRPGFEDMLADDSLDGDDAATYNENDDLTAELQKNITNVLLIIVLLIIPIKFLIGLFKHIYHEHRAKKLTNNKRIIYLYKQICRLLGFLSYSQVHGETHHEYADRIAYKFFTHNVKGIQEITDIFVRSKYGNASGSDEDVLDLMIYRKTLEKRLRAQWRPIIFYYRKYVRKGYMEV